ncbi:MULTISPECIES: LIC12162 family transferase [Leptospira]|uniref:Transferase n=1 Tax=Leptospira santarosai TaxID=28183 RepID=A0AB73LLQ2_9LEPT|nr:MULTISPECIES: LIC12162 family protein [Leptospira]EKO78288.1 transferase, TIGR04331 family [Leptospira sp. Fiocruz LV3954]EMI69141.1 transferase, TIGR04331 family [Leptospira sp. Fiocruz LV4135]EMO15314.1 putative transferase, LIC12162 family [Leptospira santarosai str. CBC523]ONF91992.1 transferase [Leptospira santarosai]
MKRYLITTADERTWIFDRPVLFLGQWCLRYDRKHVWSNLKFEVAVPYGVNPIIKKRDLDYLNDLNEVFLSEISGMMNKLHSVSHSNQYWNLVLGHWIQRYLRAFYNRYKTIEQALDRYEISGTVSLEFDLFELASNDSIGFIFNVNKDFWNHILNVEILKFFGVKFIDYKNELAYEKNTKRQYVDSGAVWKRFLLYTINNILPLFSRKSDAFLINTYLPFRSEIFLQLKLKQFPQIWKNRGIPEWDINEESRSLLNFPISTRQNFETFAWRTLSKVIPRCFVEGYKDILMDSKKINWPQKPRFIFTSNSFDTDELFKVWLAEKVSQGIPYFVGQHGNNYGTLYGSQNLPEIIDSDRFITWGWSRNTRKQIPAFVFTKCNESKGVYDPVGDLLLIEFPPAIRLGPEDTWFDFTKYFDEQVDFYKKLPEKIRKRTIIRLHNSSKHYSWFDEERWKDVDLEVKIDSYQSKLKDLIAKSRLVVHSYDSTGILETLNLNIPTICFWRNEFAHLVEEAVPFYEKLKEVGIFHSSPRGIVEFISKNWDTIDLWWFSKDVQDVRLIFCDQYARKVKNPISVLEKIFLGI